MQHHLGLQLWGRNSDIGIATRSNRFLNRLPTKRLGANVYYCVTPPPSSLQRPLVASLAEVPSH